MDESNFTNPFPDEGEDEYNYVGDKRTYTPEENQGDDDSGDDSRKHLPPNKGRNNQN